MKKLTFIIAALMVMFQSASYAVGIDFAAEFALSKANFKMKDSGIDIDNALGFGIGVSAKADLELFDVGPELWYYRHTANIGDGKLKSNSIDLPVVVSYNIIGPLAIEAGPTFSLSNSAKYTNGSQTVDLNRIRPEMGYVLGVRVTVLERLMVSGRFNGCFSKESVVFDGFGTYDMRFNSWSLAVGVKF